MINKLIIHILFVTSVGSKYHFTPETTSYSSSPTDPLLNNWFKYDLGLRLPQDVPERDQKISFKEFFKFGKTKIDPEKSKIFSGLMMHLIERMKQCVVGSGIASPNFSQLFPPTLAPLSLPRFFLPLSPFFHFLKYTFRTILCLFSTLKKMTNSLPDKKIPRGIISGDTLRFLTVKTSSHLLNLMSIRRVGKEARKLFSFREFIDFHVMLISMCE
uniref:Uncharacterized protein n=1 Tax=Cucumis melo TaxID=3656 RepID=A0A9I9EHL8_CUCME